MAYTRAVRTATARNRTPQSRRNPSSAGPKGARSTNGGSRYEEDAGGGNRTHMGRSPGGFKPPAYTVPPPRPNETRSDVVRPRPSGARRDDRSGGPGRRRQSFAQE